MRVIPGTRRAAGFVALLLLCVVPLDRARLGAAQPEKTTEKKKKEEPVESPLTQETVKKRLEELQANKDLKDDVKERIKSHYEQAAKRIESASADEKALTELQSFKRTATELEQQARQQLGSSEAMPKAADVPDDLATLEERLKSARALKDDAEAKLTKWETEQKQRLARKEVVPKRLLEAQNELKKTTADLAADPPSGEPPQVVAALRFLQKAQKKALEAEIAKLEAELPAYTATDKAVDLQIQAARKQLQQGEKLVQFWGQKVEDHRGWEARDQVQQASTTVENLTNAKMPEALVELAKQNLQLARQRTGDSGTVARLREVRRKLSDVEAQEKRLQSELTSLEEKLKIPDIAADIGPLLVAHRRRLPNTNYYNRRIAERSRSLSQLRLDLNNTREMKNRLTELRDKIRQQLSQSNKDVDKATRSRYDAALGSLMKARFEILNALQNDYDTLLEQQVNLTSEEHKLIGAAKKFRELIDKHILWIPTTLPFGMRHLEQAGNAIAWLIDPKSWRTTGETLQESLFARPIASTLAILLLAFVLFRHPMLKRRLKEMGQESSRGFTQPYALTVKSLLITILLSAIWPAVLWFAGRQLLYFSGTSPFADSVGKGLTVTAAALLTFEFLRRMFRRNGLADAHFRWKGARLKQLRRHLRWFALAALPGFFVYVLIDDFGEEDYVASLGRIIFVGLMLVVSTFLWFVFRNPQVKLPFSDALGIKHTVAAKQASIWQIGAFLGVVLFPVALAVAALAGYQYTATYLARKFLGTAWLGLVLLICHAMAMRWLYSVRGKIALEQAQTALAARKAAEERAAAAEESTQVAPAVARDGSNGSPKTGEATSPTASSALMTDVTLQPPATDLASINAQTRRLLRIAVGTGAVLGLWMIWADVLPALKFLDYPLWSYHVETASTPAGADKGAAPQTITVLKAFTLGKLLLTIAIIAVVFVAAANLPGLLEVAVLQRLPIDSGARYAVTSLSRYTIYAVGLLTAVNLMGLNWGKLQWLIAALGVGLGFGLQEIVANFVSGIILLFERPLRVGDIVTIGDVSGIVTRIQIRATTIRDWDRKEYLVPNKELVTGKLMNWTLTDTVNRVVVNVGVKYGTDGDTVRDLLLNVAQDHPVVLSDPEPLATFEGFGDSSLNFVLRCYLPDLTNRLLIIHQLHAEVQRRLGAAGIEIPFPQRDLHIRSDDTRGNGVFAGQEAEHAEA